MAGIFLEPPRFIHSFTETQICGHSKGPMCATGPACGPIIIYYGIASQYSLIFFGGELGGS